MSLYPAAYGAALGPIACAEECIASCRQTRGGYLGLVPIYPTDPEAYGRCLNDCQSDCPGGAPTYQPGLCEADIACAWGPVGQLLVTAGGVAESVVAAVTPGTLPNLLLLVALGAAALLVVRAL